MLKILETNLLKYFKMTRQPRRQSQCGRSQRLPCKEVKKVKQVYWYQKEKEIKKKLDISNYQGNAECWKNH